VAVVVGLEVVGDECSVVTPEPVSPLRLEVLVAGGGQRADQGRDEKKEGGSDRNYGYEE
jgi:hypothetical protein